MKSDLQTIGATYHRTITDRRDHHHLFFHLNDRTVIARKIAQKNVDLLRATIWLIIVDEDHDDDADRGDDDGAEVRICWRYKLLTKKRSNENVNIQLTRGRQQVWMELIGSNKYMFAQFFAWIFHMNIYTRETENHT